MGCSRALLSSSSVPRTLHSLTSPAICECGDGTQPLTRLSSHICFELLKNSLRAVVERYGEENEDSFPPVKVIVVEGSEDITIKISDEGGGIPRSALPVIWTYLYTTMSDEGLEATIESSDFKAPMAGFGYGLPLSRLYARYFGGDLRLISMDGYGTGKWSSCEQLWRQLTPPQTCTFRSTSCRRAANPCLDATPTAVGCSCKTVGEGVELS